jgi:signal transduction histidine kinase
MRNAMEQNEAIERDEVIVNLDKEIPIGFSVSPLQKDDRGISGCVSIFRDLSEIKALQEKMKQIEKLSYLGKMASWMAHEIRNPLASIDGFAQLLVDTQKPEKIRLFSTEILKGARRIDNIIEDTLAFAKTSRKKPTLVPIDLRELVNDIVADINIKIDISGGQKTIVNGEPESLRRVFINLVTNAMDAMDSSGTLTIKFSHDDRFCITKIVDTGSGISEENMKHIMTPFFTTKERSTGLGLAIVEKILEEHNGRIEITSAPNEGTKVIVFLPHMEKR